MILAPRKAGDVARGKSILASVRPTRLDVREGVTLPAAHPLGSGSATRETGCFCGLRLNGEAAMEMSVRSLGGSCRSDGWSSASRYLDIDGDERAFMEFGEAPHPIGDIAERRYGRKAERNLIVLEDDPQPRLARLRLMKSAHFGLL